MANSLKKNVYHIDTIGTINVDRFQPIINAILIVPNATDSHVIIKESVGGTIVLDVVIEQTESRFITFESLHDKGIILNSQFEIAELTNVDRIILYGDFKKTSNTPG